MDACVAQRVLALPFIVICGLGGEGVAHKFSIQIARMIGLLQWKAKIIQGKDIFEKFRILKCANAACLTAVVERMGECVGLCVEVVVVPRSVSYTHLL